MDFFAWIFIIFILVLIVFVIKNDNSVDTSTDNELKPLFDEIDRAIDCLVNIRLNTSCLDYGPIMILPTVFSFEDIHLPASDKIMIAQPLFFDDDPYYLSMFQEAVDKHKTVAGFRYETDDRGTTRYYSYVTYNKFNGKNGKIIKKIYNHLISHYSYLTISNDDPLSITDIDFKKYSEITKQKSQKQPSPAPQNISKTTQQTGAGNQKPIKSPKAKTTENPDRAVILSKIFTYVQSNKISPEKINIRSTKAEIIYSNKIHTIVYSSENVPNLRSATEEYTLAAALSIGLREKYAVVEIKEKATQKHTGWQLKLKK